MAIGENRIGMKIGTWTVFEEVPPVGARGGQRSWRLRCECGREQTKRGVVLLSWKGGCLCGQTFGKGHPLYSTWLNMKDRCFNSRGKSYPEYGGRGIKICERWLVKGSGFRNFAEDVGPRPAGMSLDRVNVNGNYEPNNVRWATAKEQSANQRLSKQRVNKLFDMLEEIIGENPATTADVLLKVLRKQLFGSAT
jgi:hypothetical protein